MDKYTDLQQAVEDPSLVIISDDSISTQKELGKAIIRYKILPKPQKRYSNYYSNKFLGRSVPEMYILMRDKLPADQPADPSDSDIIGISDINDILGDLELQSEKYVVSEPDLYYKENSFNSGDTNICFILGHSGSGKSSMAKALRGDNIDHIELDDLLLTKDHFTKEDLRNYSDMMHSFFDGEGAKYYIGADERDDIPKEEYEDKVFTDFVKFAMNYSKHHAEKKYIIEGIWIYLYFDDPSVFDDYAVFIKGTSFLKSKIRTMKREMQRDIETLQDRKKMFGRETRNYLLDEDKIDIYRRYFSDSPDTIFREEINETTQKQEAVASNLKNIDKCFVNEDADGIKEIMKAAESDAELPGLDKLMIINECESALFDLSLSAAWNGMHAAGDKCQG